MKKRAKYLVACGLALDQRPRVKGLEPDIAAEVLLRAGVLTGWIGGDQITDAQEQAKDFISESLAIFESRKYKKKASRSTDRTSSVLHANWRVRQRIRSS